jgi:uncharacterized Zn-finger protein
MSNNKMSNNETSNNKRQEEIFKERNSIVVHDRIISCDGEGGDLGHPLVYLSIDSKSNEINCPYCGNRFIYKQAL